MDRGACTRRRGGGEGWWWAGGFSLLLGIFGAGLALLSFALGAFAGFALLVVVPIDVLIIPGCVAELVGLGRRWDAGEPRAANLLGVIVGLLGSVLLIVALRCLAGGPSAVDVGAILVVLAVMLWTMAGRSLACARSMRRSARRRSIHRHVTG